MEKNVNMSLLLDFYGSMLTDKQRETVDLYYNNDLSLAEVAELIGISRQGVHDRIIKSEEILKNFELKLGLAADFDMMKSTLTFVAGRLDEIKNQTGADIDDVISAVNKLIEL